MSHDVMQCPDCNCWIMEGNEDWWCDNCDAYYSYISDWKWIKLERNSDKKLLKDIYELSCRRFNGAEFNLELLQQIRDISLSAFQ